MKYKFIVPILYVLICIFWGSSWLVIKLSLEYISPFTNLGLRFLISAFTIFLVMIWTNTKLDLSRKSMFIYLILGIFSYTIPFNLVYWAEQTIPSSLASILFGMYPFFVAILSTIFIKEDTMSISRFVGILMSFTGLLFIFVDGLKIELSTYYLGMIAVVSSALMQASVAIFIKKNGGHLNPLSMNFIPTLIAGSVLIVMGLLTEDMSKNKFSIVVFLMIIYLAVIVTVFNFTAYYWLLKRISIVLLSLTSFITPIIAVFLGVVVHGEKLSSKILSGSAFVLLGIIIVNWDGIKKVYHQKRFSSL